MSRDPQFSQLIETMLHAKKSSDRAEAARTLGRFVEQLNDEEYQDARSALNNALADPDPLVLMEAMQALTNYDRQARTIRGEDFEVHGDAESDFIQPAERAVCKVCGRPEALIPENGCDRADCPYR